MKTGNIGEKFELKDTGLLSTATIFDRESATHVPFQLNCSIQGPSPSDALVLTTLSTLSQNLTLIVEDEDDNPPRLQTPEEQQIVDVYLKDQGIVQVRN